ncbi:MAG TPA: hypothetical protein VMV84_01265, partial [Dehalococcoidales bacterium]|nr:hypothetical protein [Dehalococcoidales bacterium]
MVDKALVGVLLQEGGRIISEIIRIRPISTKRPGKPQESISQEIPGDEKVEVITLKSSIEEKVVDVKTGCVACSLGHLGTCTGLLNEAMGFARHDGLNNVEVIDRMNKCLDELNALERVDLDSEKIAYLPDNEKKLALTALEASRNTRHNIENISSVDELERITAETQTVRMAIGRKYFQDKLSK